MDIEIETKKIMRDAIVKFSESMECDTKETQIRIYSEDSKPKYKILRKYADTVPATELTLKELMLTPKIDMTGKGIKAMLIEPQIKNILVKLSKFEKWNVDDTSVVVVSMDNEGYDLKLVVCRNEKPIKKISFEKLLGT